MAVQGEVKLRLRLETVDGFGPAILGAWLVPWAKGEMHMQIGRFGSIAGFALQICGAGASVIWPRGTLTQRGPGHLFDPPGGVSFCSNGNWGPNRAAKLEGNPGNWPNWIYGTADEKAAPT